MSGVTVVVDVKGDLRERRRHSGPRPQPVGVFAGNGRLLADRMHQRRASSSLLFFAPRRGLPLAGRSFVVEPVEL